MSKAIIFCDGACKGNPGPGGYAAKIWYTHRDPVVVIGKAKNTTNNRMELQAAIVGLRAIQEVSVVEINTDSQYLKRGISEWIHNWKRNGWRAANGKPVKNQDLWKDLDFLASMYSIEWKWVPAHSGIPENEEVDRLAQACSINELSGLEHTYMIMDEIDG